MVIGAILREDMDITNEAGRQSAAGKKRRYTVIPSLQNNNTNKFKRKDLETKTISLRACLIFCQSMKILLISRTDSPHKVYSAKRASRCISAKQLNGGISIETALAFPIFLFFMLNLISIINVFYAYSSVEAALHQTGRKMAVYAYALEEISDIEEEETDWRFPAAFSAAYVREQVREYLGEEFLDKSSIKGGIDGISFIQSEILSEDDMIDLTAVYQVQPAFGFMGFGEFRVINRCRMHAWTGYDNTRNSPLPQEGDPIVYITETGTVYHKDRSCTHLNLSVQIADYDTLEGRRNQYGGRYHLCELCAPVTGGIVYITEQGNKYHTTAACSGLKRTITAISITETGGRTPCTRCSS